jgi:SAM-dependent methyltransferase
MNLFLNGLARAVAETFTLPDPILEIGSYQVEGQDGLGELRGLFPGNEYCGIDVRPGPGVDLVADVEELPHLTGTVGTVLAMSTFEHVRHFWRGFDEIRRVLRPDGVLLVAVPFHFQIHNYPSDYWRFTPQAMEVLLDEYPSKIVGWHGPEDRPANVWALAFRGEQAPISAAQFDAYRRNMARFAHMPLPWHRRWRYRLARVLCGRRPVAPWLDRERWQCRLLSPPAPRTSDEPVERTADRPAAGSVGVHRELELSGHAARVPPLA